MCAEDGKPKKVSVSIEHVDALDDGPACRPNIRCLVSKSKNIIIEKECIASPCDGTEHAHIYIERERNQ